MNVTSIETIYRCINTRTYSSRAFSVRSNINTHWLSCLNQSPICLHVPVSGTPPCDAIYMVYGSSYRYRAQYRQCVTIDLYSIQLYMRNSLLFISTRITHHSRDNASSYYKAYKSYFDRNWGKICVHFNNISVEITLCYVAVMIEYTFVHLLKGFSRAKYTSFFSYSNFCAMLFSHRAGRSRN